MKLKGILVGLVVLALLTQLAISFSSCNNEKDTAPNLAFIVDTTRLISNDTSLLHASEFSIGIKASKTGTTGLLSSMTIARSINGNADSVIQEMHFVQQSFVGIYSYLAPDSGVVNRYTFTATKADGYNNSISLTITGR